MNKNIVVLSGSARKNGNSEKLIASFKEGAESVGKNVTVFRVADMAIGGCVGCEYCIDNEGKCSLKDDMTIILDALSKTDVIVWASPIYYFSFTAQLKAVIDRMYPLINDKPKQTALLLVCADDDIDTAAGALAIYHRTIKYYNWSSVGIVIATEVEHLGDIDGKPVLEEARQLGVSS